MKKWVRIKTDSLTPMAELSEFKFTQNAKVICSVTRRVNNGYMYYRSDSPHEKYLSDGSNIYVIQTV